MEILTGETRAVVVVAAAAVSSLRESERQRRRPEGRRFSGADSAARGRRVRATNQSASSTQRGGVGPLWMRKPMKIHENGLPLEKIADMIRNEKR